MRRSSQRKGPSWLVFKGHSQEESIHQQVMVRMRDERLVRVIEENDAVAQVKP